MPWTDVLTLARQHHTRVVHVFHGACVQAGKLDLGHASLLVVAVSVPLFLCLLEETGTSKSFTLPQAVVLARCRVAPGIHRPTLA